MTDIDRGSWPIADREAFRAAVRSWISQSWSPTITVREWWRRLAAAGLTVPTWGKPFGGLGATAAIQQIIEDELAAAGTIAPPLGGIGVHLVGPTLRQHGSFAQFDRFLPGMADGTSAWCLLFAEPDSPSDLSAITATAHSVGGSYSSGEWTIEGSKVAADANLADHGLLLARTDPTSTGRHGLSCFAIALDQPGVIVHVLDDGSSMVSLQSAAVDRDSIIGPAGGGWQVAQTTLAHLESSLAGRIRRGLVHLTSGPKAGYLDLTVAEALAAHVERQPPDDDRRS